MAGIIHPIKTIRLIDEMIEKDQGASFRVWLGKVLPHIGDAYRGEDGGHRSHLGASLLGEECARKIWYGFRWATKSKFPGRVLRLFNRGHLEEGRIIAQFLMIGCQFWQQDQNGNQFRISWAEGHAGGSGDGVGMGIPDLPPTTAFLTEFKTHSEKSFVDMAGKLPDWRKYVEGKGQFTGKGVKVSKPEHYVQMQLYMRKMGLTCAFYVAVCKNTDDQYMELIMLDSSMADQFLDRGEKLVWQPTPPPKINKSAGFYKCVFCDHNPVCQRGAPADINCRSCQFSEPRKDAVWFCNKHMTELSKEKQQVACPNWHQNEDF